MAKPAPKLGLSGKFNATMPEGIRLANGDPGVIAQIAGIEARADRVQQRVRDSYKEHRELWVVREMRKLTLEGAGLTGTKSSLTATAKAHARQNLEVEARRNVHAHVVKKLTKIENIRQRMSNAALRNKQDNHLKIEAKRHNEPQITPKQRRRQKP